MPTSIVKPAGNYTLKEFNISTFFGKVMGPVPISTNSTDENDAKLLIYNWSIDENLNASTVSGSAVIYDSVGLYYDMPLRGEERLRITYEDFFGNERTEDLFIYSVTDLHSPKDVNADMLAYTIHFVSVGKLIADTKIIRKAYKGLISNIAQEVFDAVYTDMQMLQMNKEISIEQTLGEQVLIVPQLNGSETMNFLSRRAYGGNDETSTYRFFENRKEYGFSTIENLVNKSEEKDEITNFVYDISKDETPEGQLSKMYSILAFDIPQSVDTLSSLYSGSYSKKVTELDYLTRRVLMSDYNFDQSYPSYNENMSYGNVNTIRPNHSEEFIRTFLNTPKNYLVLKDYPDTNSPNTPSFRPKTNYADMIGPSWSTMDQHKDNMIMVRIYGRNDLFAGDVVSLEMGQFRHSNQQVDKKLSGKYLVEGISNEFVGDKYFQTLKLSRGGSGI